MGYIGKNGQIRFKISIAKLMKLEHGQVWRIGMNKEKSTLYFIKPENGQESLGFKMIYNNKSWFFFRKRIERVFNLLIIVTIYF